MPRTYLSTMGRGSSADCPDSYCGLTTANAIMCLWLGIKTVDEPRPIYYKGEGYEEVNRKDLNGLYRRYYSDPVGYMTAGGKVTVKMQDRSGKSVAPPKGVPYNPIER